MSATHPQGAVVPFPVEGPKDREPAVGDSPGVLADVFREEVNIAVWQRTLGGPLEDAARQLAGAGRQIESTLTVQPDTVEAELKAATRNLAPDELIDDVASLVTMFCELLGIRRTGLRLATLRQAMCPRFHVDRVPARLITTYCGVGTEWLPHDAVDRTKLGTGNNGQPDLACGLFRREDDIQRLNVGDVALLKGELWPQNEGAGLVHRSPSVPPRKNRLLLSLDVSD